MCIRDSTRSTYRLVGPNVSNSTFGTVRGCRGAEHGGLGRRGGDGGVAPPRRSDSVRPRSLSDGEETHQPRILGHHADAGCYRRQHLRHSLHFLGRGSQGAEMAAAGPGNSVEAGDACAAEVARTVKGGEASLVVAPVVITNATGSRAAIRERCLMGAPYGGDCKHFPTGAGRAIRGGSQPVTGGWRSWARGCEQAVPAAPRRGSTSRRGAAARPRPARTRTVPRRWRGRCPVVGATPR